MPAPFRHASRLLIFALVIEYLVVPQLAGSRRALHLVVTADPIWIIAGLLFECGSLIAYASLTRAVLPERGRPSWWVLFRIDLTTLGVSHLVPAGSAAGLGLGYRMLTLSGVKPPDAVFGKALQTVGSAVVLNVLLWLSLVVSIPLHGFSPVYGPIALLGVVLLGAVGGLVALLTKGEERAGDVLVFLLGRIPGLGAERIRRWIAQLAVQLREFGSDRAVLRRAVGWATANWLLDAMSLWSCVKAFGHTLGPVGLVVPYGIANVLAALPFTPGGLGIVEGFLIPALVGFSTPRGQAILGVLVWRFYQFLLPIPAGGVAYLTLRRTMFPRVEPAEP